MGPGLLNTNWGPEPVNKNRGPGPVNTNWGPGPGLGAKDSAGGQEIQILHILSYVSPSKENQTMKFGQLIINFLI